jgi:hypothetical protein
MNCIIHNADGYETTKETSGDDKTEWLAFMAHIAHSEVETMEQELLNYKYIIGLETSEYEHMHFFVKMTIKQYSAFAQRIFRKKYKLLGRATKGCPRQYGREHNIKSQEKMARYTCKDQNVRSNMTKAQIDEVLGMKIEEVKNTKNRNKYEKMLEYVEEKLKHNGYHDTHNDPVANEQVKIAIIGFIRENTMHVRKATIENYYYYFRMNTKIQHYGLTDTQIYEQIYNIYQAHPYQYA